MSVVSPPRGPRPSPQPDDPDLLIKEARERRRRRRLRIAAAGAAVAVGAGVYAVLHFGGSAGPRSIQPGGASGIAYRCPPGNLGTVAFIRRGALNIVDLRGCSTRVLVGTGVTGPVQFSYDGRFVAFNGGFVPSRGGAVTRTEGVGTWSPTSEVLAVVTKRGGLVLARPHRPAQRLLPDGWGVLTLTFAPDGHTLAVSRSRYTSPSIPAAKWHQEIWSFDVRTGARRLIFKLKPPALAPAWLQGFSPDERWLLFWQDSQNSASLGADGLPLVAVPVRGGKPIRITSELHRSDFLAWCGNALVYVIDRGGRQVTRGDGIAVAKPPTWRSQTVLAAGGKTSWNSVACPAASAAAGGGGLVVAGGPSNDDSPFGHERRSLWLLSPSPRAKPQRLGQTVPPRGQTDELPLWSGDGRWLLFVRTKPGGIAAGGALYAIDPFGGNLVGPIADIGTAGNYYGSYSWPYQLDWHR